MKVPPQITWLQYALANLAIVILIPFLALQGMPPIDWAWTWATRPSRAAAREQDEEAEDQQPSAEMRLADEVVPTPVTDWLLSYLLPAAHRTGVSTAPWKMFAPDPDHTNHRLRAKIEYRDGTVVYWRTPDWPQMSCWR